LIIEVQETRSFYQNAEIAKEKLNWMINIVISPPKERIQTKVPQKQKEKRKVEKKRIGEKKKARQKIRPGLDY